VEAAHSWAGVVVKSATEARVIKRGTVQCSRASRSEATCDDIIGVLEWRLREQR
jgi:hypothetical protein